MIQKIRVLQGELNAPQILGPSEPCDPGRKSPTTQRFQNNNGSVVTGCGAADDADSPVMGTASSRTPQERRQRSDSGTTPLLLQAADSVQTTPLLHQQGAGAGAHQRHQHQRHHHHLSVGDGNDSDTASHCALLIADESAATASASASPAAAKDRHGSNGNNNYEVHELHDLNRILARNRTNIWLRRWLAAWMPKDNAVQFPFTMTATKTSKKQ